jgi:hypothetical protein
MNRQMNQMSGGQNPASRPSSANIWPSSMPIRACTVGRPAEWEMQRHFGARRFAFMPHGQACFAIKLIQIKVRFTAMGHTAFR